MTRHRKSLRLKHYDYSRAGLYFITICTQNRKCLLGEIVNRKMILNYANIPAIVQSFKRHTTIKYIQIVKQNVLPPFYKRVWQRNYWEHIIRNEQSYLEISEYIQNNPAKWAIDKLNPESGYNL